MPQLIVSGSRRWHNPLPVWQGINLLRQEFTLTEIVAGEAPGIDTLARKYALSFGIKFTPFPALWHICPPGGFMKKRSDGTPYYPYAGNLRNQAMVDYVEADALLMAFPDAQSRGTPDCIARARAKKLRVLIYPL